MLRFPALCTHHNYGQRFAPPARRHGPSRAGSRLRRVIPAPGSAAAVAAWRWVRFAGAIGIAVAVAVAVAAVVVPADAAAPAAVEAANRVVRIRAVLALVVARRRAERTARPDLADAIVNAVVVALVVCAAHDGGCVRAAAGLVGLVLDSLSDSLRREGWVWWRRIDGAAEPGYARNGTMELLFCFDCFVWCCCWDLTTFIVAGVLDRIWRRGLLIRNTPNLTEINESHFVCIAKMFLIFVLINSFSKCMTFH